MFEKFFNKKEAPEKVHAKIEDLEDQIHQEKMKLLNNEERIKAEMEYVGGIDGLNQKIEKQKKEQDRWMAHAARNIGMAMILHCLFHDSHSSEASKTVGLVVESFAGSVGILSAATMVQEWWKVKKSKMLKEEVEAATA